MSFVKPDQSPVFDPTGAHARLFADIALYARLAGIRKEWIWEPLGDRVGENERKWVSHFKGHADRGTCGILWLGAPPAQQMPAVVGALTRNFIDARLRTVEELVEDGTGAAGATALFISDFCLSDSPLTPSTRQAVTSILLRRATASQQTGLYAVSLLSIQKAYGDAVAALIEESYLKVTP